MTDTTPAEDARAATLPTPDGVKMTRETLCAAQAALGWRDASGRRAEHVDRLQRLIDACDAHRPLGPNGKHGDRHTATCGCTDRPTPPVPAAEDDAVERLRLAEYGYHWQVQETERVADALTARAVSAEQERDDARQQVADLRATMNGVLAYIDGIAGRALNPDEAEVYDRIDRALLVGSGEQPGANSQPAPSSAKAGRNHPAPAVPDSAKSAPSSAKAWSNDSAGLREQVRQAIYRNSSYVRVMRADRRSVEAITDAILAVVGQGVTAEQVEYAIDGAIPDDLPGYRRRYTEHAARRVIALLRHRDADHPSAVVGSGERGGDRG